MDLTPIVLAINSVEGFRIASAIVVGLSVFVVFLFLVTDKLTIKRGILCAAVAAVFTFMATVIPSNRNCGSCVCGTATQSR